MEAVARTGPRHRRARAHAAGSRKLPLVRGQCQTQVDGVPRMLLYRRRGETHLVPEELACRPQLAAEGRCPQLLDESAAAAQAAPATRTRPGRNQARREAGADDETLRRAERALALAHLGEFTAAPLAPANADTLTALRDPARRPQEQQVLPKHLQPAEPLSLNKARFLQNVSGCPVEHIRVLLHEETDTDLLYAAAGVRCLAFGADSWPPQA